MSEMIDRLESKEDVELAKAAQRCIVSALDHSRAVNIAILEDGVERIEDSPILKLPPKVLRLTKAQLDGACGDKRFADDFFLDLIFEPCDEATASQHLAADSKKSEDTDKTEVEGGDCANEAANRRSMGTVVGNSDTTFTASAYDSMLHRDSRFWDVISERRKENMEKMAELEKQGGKTEADNKEDANSPLAGPTIGRRRDFSSKSYE